jgi:7-carboxy-7-deazaguanine synthase
MDQGSAYPVVEIFESMQGEGYNTGQRMVFVRFGGCNLACPWCDTDFNNHAMLSGSEIVSRVVAFGVRSVLLTGGEPMIQRELGALLHDLKDAGFWIGIETNGLLAPPPDWTRRIDYLTVSPKALYAELYDDGSMVREADEVRIVADGDVRAFCEDMRARIAARRYYISPCERKGVFNIAESVRLLGELNRGRVGGKWRLSLQTHKLAGFQ